MKLVSCALGVSAIVAMTIACGSSDDGAKDETNSTPFAGASSTQSAKTCSADADCDNHDPCVTFKCDGTTGETGLGQCTYALAKTCAPDAAADATPPNTIEHVDAGAIDAPDAAVDPDAGQSCTKSFTVAITEKGPASCFYNTTVEQTSPATLTYACAGGSASVTFAPQTFVGTETNDDVSVTNVDVYTITVAKYNVKCAYRNTQTITGNLSSGTLAYTYTEKLEPNQPPLCPFITAPCSAKGTVTVK